MSVAAAVLAAGQGTRFGGDGPKPLALLSGRPLVAWALDAAVGSDLRPVVLAVPPDGGGVRAVAGADVEVVVAKRAAEGIAWSLRAVLDELERADEVSAVCVGLADQPCVGPEAYRRLAAAHAEGAALAVATAAALTSALLMGSSTAASSADQRAAALDKAIPAAMQRASIPGAIIGIWQDGSEPYVRAFGVSDTATGEKMATDLYMRIGSNSKTFTVTAILMLADQGKLSLDDPIGRYVEGVPGGDEITLRQLAAMRSGALKYLK